MTGTVDLLGGEEAIEQVTLPIDSKAMEGLGKHHTLSSAIADLIDNSISAEARAVLVRFLQSHGTVVGVQIVDNGKGMTPQGLRDGMTVGRRREYRPDELGHFGMGLKASSLSQANVLSVWTRAANNDPTGMRMTKDSMMNGAQCDILSKSSDIFSDWNANEDYSGLLNSLLITKFILDSAKVAIPDCLRNSPPGEQWPTYGAPISGSRVRDTCFLQFAYLQGHAITRITTSSRCKRSVLAVVKN
ncbi:ATP-binding protein [Pseudarthrobacter enclensis]|uniref:Histidine kinase/HSP90-like ATPase domain-containing protein n=1 Tax=Pseudarthrobacter enclensis TaxID=993070 RepID=A0ABT9RSS6_9MICC|nr:ATP-binding protein [Pseudarthrobacter enclensis]MDP9888287.1 hypothetical protein [Pseudarthrobacter enclensis]